MLYVYMYVYIILWCFCYPMTRWTSMNIWTKINVNMHGQTYVCPLLYMYTFLVFWKYGHILLWTNLLEYRQNHVYPLQCDCFGILDKYTDIVLYYGQNGNMFIPCYLIVSDKCDRIWEKGLLHSRADLFLLIIHTFKAAMATALGILPSLHYTQ